MRSLYKKPAISSPAKKLVDMQLEDEDQLDYPTPITIDKPRHPYGLRLSLTHVECDKLGIDPSTVEVGGYLHIVAFATVKHRSTTSSESGNTACVELQIEKMAVEDELKES